jgi:hypothetical protein
MRYSKVILEYGIYGGGPKDTPVERSDDDRQSLTQNIMGAKIGTPLAPKMVAWVWFSVAAGFSLVCAWKAMEGQLDWTFSAVSAGVALLIYLEPRLRRREVETVQLDDVGILRVEGSIREEVRWEAVTEIKIITTDSGPYGEDVFFVLSGTDERGCVVSHAAAVRTKLLETLQIRFPNLDDAAVIAAMGCTSNNSFLLWRRPVAGAASVARDG